jgi:hypothetical protein
MLAHISDSDTIGRRGLDHRGESVFRGARLVRTIGPWTSKGKPVRIRR